tara:strand:- start:296 stop:1120 length:825 start_codon:yes stop_codon:yes gene_type:complete
MFMPITQGGHHFAPNFYDDIVSAGLDTNLKLVLDAGATGSYAGSGQTFSDLTASGADFWFGAASGSSTDDPTFNGTAGGLSSAEFMSFDGGDFFELKTSNPTFVNNMHKNNALLSALCWVYVGTVSSEDHIFGTSGSLNAKIGVELSLDTGIRFAVRGTGTNVGNFRSDSLPSSSAWHLIGITINEAGGASGSFFYEDGGYNQVSSSNTFNAAYSSPSASSATHPIQVGGNGASTDLWMNGGRIAGVMIWEGSVLSKANMDTIWNAQKSRFGLS